MKTPLDTEDVRVRIGREKKNRKNIKSEGDVKTEIEMTHKKKENGPEKETNLNESSPIKKKRRDKTLQDSPAQVFPSSAYYETTATQVSAIRTRITQIGDFRPYPCEICDKAFTTNAVLVRHIKTHTGEKPFSCSYCDKRFPRKDTLVGHERIHTGERPYSCKYCPKTFASSCERLRHLRTHPGQVKPYDCPYCSKEFVTKNALTGHLIIHEKTGAFRCSVCDKYFSQKYKLVAHEKTKRHLKKSKSNLNINKIKTKHSSKIKTKITQEESLVSLSRIQTTTVSNATNSTITNQDSKSQNIMRKSSDKQPKKVSVKTTPIKQKSTNEHLIESLDKKVSKSKPYECRTCRKFFSSKVKLKNHKMGKHGLKNKSNNNGESSVVTQQPTTEPASMTLTPITEEPKDETHIKSSPEKELKSKKKHNCGGCAKLFSSKDKLKEHRRRRDHESYKPHQCPVCQDTTFKTIKGLGAHYYDCLHDSLIEQGFMNESDLENIDNIHLQLFHFV